MNDEVEFYEDGSSSNSTAPLHAQGHGWPTVALILTILTIILFLTIILIPPLLHQLTQ